MKNVNPNIIKNFSYLDKSLDINKKYILNKKSKYSIYFYCSKKRQLCPGSIKYIIDNNEWVILNQCSKDIEHNTCKFEDF